jgi:hypothetical protein
VRDGVPSRVLLLGSTVDLLLLDPQTSSPARSGVHVILSNPASGSVRYELWSEVGLDRLPRPATKRVASSIGSGKTRGGWLSHDHVLGTLEGRPLSPRLSAAEGELCGLTRELIRGRFPHRELLLSLPTQQLK